MALVKLCNSIKNFSSLSIEVTFDIFESATSVPSVYKETAGLNKLTVEN